MKTLVIHNYYNKTYINDTFDTKANKSDVYTKTQLDDKLNTKQNTISTFMDELEDLISS